ncbi:MAG: FAD-dependent oxidoreductase [Oscillospiraceae bacterium]|nr:FAD-dependent oxidoreductase [Oscillospiraceae bacterium]
MASIRHETAKMPQFPTLDKDISTDVLIIGGGMAGILCAHKLSKAGADYVLVEANTIGSGITRNTTAKISAQHGLVYHKLIRKLGEGGAQQYLQANLNALEEYRTLCNEMDCDFQDQDSFIYALDNQDLLETEWDALRALGYEAELVRKIPLPFPNAGAVKFPRQAQFHPLKFLACIASGLRIYEHTKVQELAPGIASTASGVIHAQKILVATHFPFLNKHGNYFLKMYQQRSYCLALENAPIPNGMYLGAQKNSLSFRSYGDLLILGGGGHRTGKKGGNWQELEAFAKKYYPQHKILYRWATQDCMSLDGIPYIGQYSARTPDLFVATGFNKWGMTSSMVAANILSDLVLGKEDPYASIFLPSRSILLPQLALNAWETTTNLLRPSTKRCPHLGCAMKWNPQERSWDCPCHGSRFDENGKLLDNPATNDLNS